MFVQNWKKLFIFLPGRSDFCINSIYATTTHTKTKYQNKTRVLVQAKHLKDVGVVVQQRMRELVSTVLRYMIGIFFECIFSVVVMHQVPTLYVMAWVFANTKSMITAWKVYCVAVNSAAMIFAVQDLSFLHIEIQTMVLYKKFFF